MELKISEWDQVVRNVNAMLATGVDEGEVHMEKVSVYFKRQEAKPNSTDSISIEIQKDE